MMIQSNETVIIETSERVECWIIKDSKPHALMLSCPLDKKHEMIEAVEQIKSLNI